MSSPLWYHGSFQASGRYPWMNGTFQTGIAENLSAAAASTAANPSIASAATGAAQSASSAFHPPLPPNGANFSHYAPHPSPYPNYNMYNSRGYYRYGRGPRLFPVLLVAGGAAWGYHHLKHSVRDLSYEVDSLKVTLARNFTNGAGLVAPVVEDQQPTAVQEKVERRRWGRRWSDREGDEFVGAGKNQRLV